MHCQLFHGRPKWSGELFGGTSHGKLDFINVSYPFLVIFGMYATTFQRFLSEIGSYFGN